MCSVLQAGAEASVVCYQCPAVENGQVGAFTRPSGCPVPAFPDPTVGHLLAHMGGLLLRPPCICFHTVCARFHPADSQEKEDGLMRAASDGAQPFGKSRIPSSLLRSTVASGSNSPYPVHATFETRCYDGVRGEDGGGAVANECRAW